MKTNGFRASHRNRWLFISEGVLTINEMILLDFYIDKINFSPTSEDAGTFDLDYEELDLFLGKKESTIAALNKSLTDKGFLVKINPYKFEVTNWRRYFLEEKNNKGGLAFQFQKDETNKPLNVIIRNLGINFQITGKREEYLPNNSTVDTSLIKRLIKKDINIQNSNIGEKENSEIDKREKNVFGQFPKWVLIQQKPRTDKEYQKIQDEQTDEMKMQIDDMKWIDQNAHEFIKIEDEEKENWVVSVYFNNDRARYEKYLDINQTSVTICL